MLGSGHGDKECLQKIWDFRIVFLNKLIRLVFCYFTLLTAYSYKAESLDLYKLLESFRALGFLNADLEKYGYVKVTH